jgi:hypothetical protein
MPRAHYPSFAKDLGAPSRERPNHTPHFSAAKMNFRQTAMPLGKLDAQPAYPKLPARAVVPDKLSILSPNSYRPATEGPCNSGRQSSRTSV